MVDNWSTVMATKRLRVGSYSANSLCYVSFGFGLKSSMCKGDIYIVQMLVLHFIVFFVKVILCRTLPAGYLKAMYILAHQRMLGDLP